MLKIPFLRNILLVAFLFATIFPIYDLFYIIPSYQHLLIQETERDAELFVRHLILSNHLHDTHVQYEKLRHENIPESLFYDIAQLKEEGKLEKIRIFSPAGEVIFSTDEQEIGTINNKEYFKEVVAKGNFYSKLVRNESFTAEGVATDIDLVETYVPVMIEGRFQGAMEIYYNVSSSQASLASLSKQTFFMLLATSVGLLALTFLLLLRAHKSIVARDQAEGALQQANAELENRVEQRTLELSTTNQHLAAEISERKKAQQAQREAFVATMEARDRIDAIIASVADALLVTDQQDAILLINPAAETLFNVKAVDVLGCRLSDVIEHGELKLELEKARNVLVHAESVDFDFTLRHEEVSSVYQGRVSRLREATVNGRGLILLIHDVTRERKIDHMKSEFVSMAAHELQTPLTMILGYSELLLDLTRQFEPDVQKEFLQIINDKSFELSGLIDDILDLSRIEDGKGLQLEFTHVDIASLCRQVIANFERTNSHHNFVTEFDFENMFVDADEARLIQVMENLLGNAIKYSPEGGEIRVVLTQEEGWMRLDIIDQGIGMSSEEKEQAFERFYRADASNTAVRGTGLGLSITKYIIDAHAGKIDIFSSKGMGTRLEIRLPLVQ
jgi:PAS domain S-box-containing protein